MSEVSWGAPGALVLHLQVPAAGDLRGIAPELGARIAAHFGTDADAAAVEGALEQLAQRVADPDGAPGAVIDFHFRHENGELVVEARSGPRAAEFRHPLP